MENPGWAQDTDLLLLSWSSQPGEEMVLTLVGQICSHLQIRINAKKVLDAVKEVKEEGPLETGRQGTLL